jgi:hypothetical protein
VLVRATPSIRASSTVGAATARKGVVVPTVTQLEAKLEARMLPADRACGHSPASRTRTASALVDRLFAITVRVLARSELTLARQGGAGAVAARWPLEAEAETHGRKGRAATAIARGRPLLWAATPGLQLRSSVRGQLEWMIRLGASKYGLRGSPRIWPELISRY